MTDTATPTDDSIPIGEPGWSGSLEDKLAVIVAGHRRDLDSDDPAVTARARTALEPVADGVTRAEAAYAAMYAMRGGGYTTPEIEAERLVADRDRARRAELSAGFGGDLPDAPVRDLTPPPVLPPEPTAPAALPMEDVARFQALDAEVKRLDAELKEVKRQKAALSDQLVAAFTEAETQSVNVRGRTVHLHRTVVGSKAPGVETPQLVAALRNAGLEDLITKDTVMANTLSAYVRELDAADKDLPPALADVVSKFEKFEIRVNTTSGSKRS